MATIAEALMTAEEFARRPDPGYPEELVARQGCRHASARSKTRLCLPEG